MKGCPIHGTKFLVKEDDYIYCNAPIPKDAFGLKNCFYHVNQKPGREKAKVCSECKKRKPYKIGTLCKVCRNKKQKEYYKRRKNNGT